MEAGKPADVKDGKPKGTWLGKYGPESKMFDELKGSEVCISWKNGDSGIRAILLWVDRYTIGVRLQNGNKAMVYKDAIKLIEPGDQKRTPKP